MVVLSGEAAAFTKVRIVFSSKTINRGDGEVEPSKESGAMTDWLSREVLFFAIFHRAIRVVRAGDNN